MPDLASHQSSSTTKLLIIGGSGSGKTGSLCSLAAAGYNLRLLDMDNGVDIIHNLLSDPDRYPPEALSRVKFETLTDTMRNANGRLMPGKVTVWQRVSNLLSNWKTPTEDLGSITTWSPTDVLVVDSLSRLAQHAVYFTQSFNARVGQKMTWDDIYGAQQLLETFAMTLFDSAVKCQVVILCHPDYIEDESGVKRGYPSTVGNKLSPRFGQYFNNILEARSTGSGRTKRHVLATKSSSMIETKTSAPNRVRDEYPIETGLAEFFRDIQGRMEVTLPAAAPKLAVVP